MNLRASRVLVGGGILGAVAALVLACGDDAGSSQFENEEGSSPGFGSDASFVDTGKGDADLYANDPPPKWCGPGNEPAPPQPGGTEECPDDKNKPGCGCTKAGETAPCWTGLRKHRGLGICKDGQTVCRPVNEARSAWGECEGQVLPVQGATKGKEACGCFSLGQWKIANLSPCTMSYTNNGVEQVNAVSTVVGTDGLARCPETNPPTAPPAAPWSTNTLTVDCAGHFKLCLRVRQGVFETPSANDCILGEVCTEADYKTANVEQAWPDLPAWLGTDKACAKKWNDISTNTPNVSAGYAEMVVKGKSVRCDEIDDGSGGDLVFNRVKYCPRSCNEAGNQNNPECVACQQSGQGQF